MLPGRSGQSKCLDVCRAAKQLIAQHGGGAVLHAIRRANFLLKEGNSEGAAVWRTILGAIKELQRAREPDEAVN
jgi:hypothetical protein